MKYLFKTGEYKTAGGRWRCINLEYDSMAWWVHARVLETTPAQFITDLITKYKVNHLKYDRERNFLAFEWDNAEDAIAYKNMINELAAAKQFFIKKEKKLIF